MKNKILFRTNLLVCAILIIGFIFVSVVGYYSNTGASRVEIENVSALTSESIFYQITAFFTKPVNVSLTMANDSLLKQSLLKESEQMDEPAYIKQLQDYLNAYKKQYGYDSVFLVSAQTNRYYHFNGINRILTPENPENVWYYDFLNGDEEYSLNVDNDEAAEDVITVFVNCRIKDSNGETLGVVGVGLRIENLQQLLASYDKQYQINVMLIDENGVIQISSMETEESGVCLFDDPSYEAVQEEIFQDKIARKMFWKQEEQFVAACYVPELKWHLIVENGTEEMQKRLERQFLIGLTITALIILLVLYIINRIFFIYNEKLVKLAISQELEYQNLLRTATEGLYENVFEIDITHDRIQGESIVHYLEGLGMSASTPYHEAVLEIAKRQIKPEFSEGYIAAFNPENVLRTYHNGINELHYDFMITNDGEHYRWMRIRARLFFWESDQSLRMITYRKDITAEKTKAEYQSLLQKTAVGLYENVFELDITHDCAGGESTMRYFESLGMSADIPYHEAIKIIAARQIDSEFVDGYLFTFSTENILDNFRNGKKELYYDFRITNDGEHFRWMRIRARLFFWESDQSVRMITYRQNITAEKEHEEKLFQMAQSDSLTGLYNKIATGERISEVLRQSDGNNRHALIMLDIDHFKEVNDTYGHAVGDHVIQEFAKRIKQEAGEKDICGRAGGDEFIIFLQDIPNQAWLVKKLKKLSHSLRENIMTENVTCAVSASIGAAVYPEAGEEFSILYRNADRALYQSKTDGRNRFTVYQK